MGRLVLFMPVVAGCFEWPSWPRQESADQDTEEPIEDLTDVTNGAADTGSRPVPPETTIPLAAGEASSWTGLPWDEGVFCAGLFEDGPVNEVSEVGLLYMHLDTGESLFRPSFGLDFVPLSSLALFEETFRVCNPDPDPDFGQFPLDMILTVDIDSGTVTTSGVACGAVADVGKDTLILEDSAGGGSQMRWASQPRGAEPLVTGLSASRVGHADEGQAILASRSSYEIDRWTFATQERAVVPLGAYGGWVQGISQVGDRLFVTDGQKILEYDGAGAHVTSYKTGEWRPLEGLSCHEITLSTTSSSSTP